MFLSFGFNKHMTSKEATEKFSEAIYGHHFGRAKELVETGLIDPNIFLENVPATNLCNRLLGDLLNDYVLILAIEFRQKDLVQALIKAGADVNTGYTSSYSTPLDRATVNGDTPIVKLLLEAGARAGIESALDYALHNGYRDISELISADIKKRSLVNTASPSKQPSAG